MITSTAEPVRWDDEIGAFRVAGFVEAAAVLRGEGWSSDPRNNPLLRPELREVPRGTLLFADPPEHTRVRQLLNPAFTPKVVTTLRPRITAIVDAVVDGLPDIGPYIDVLADVSYPITLSVIAEPLDVGAEGAHLFAEVTPQLVRMLEIDAGPDDVAATLAASTELTLFLTPILHDRALTPGDDFISALLALQTGPDGLGLDEVLATCITLLAAGHETTANLITNSTLALLNQPEQIPHLLANPQAAIEELLRLEGAAKVAGRAALVDQELGGQHIRAEQAVIVDIQAANRDARRFPDPERLDLTRKPTGHLAFGAGPHFCIGAALARLEATVALTHLFARYPDLSLADGPALRRRESTTFYALEELPVRLGR
jgi:pimeloyl-[acyl-carrier protein] synthase